MEELKNILDVVRARVGHAPQWPIATVEMLQRDWTFIASRPTLMARALRWRAQRTRRATPPLYRTLMPLCGKARWTCAFLFLPDGRLTPSQGYLLQRLRARDAALLVVCASPAPNDVPGAVLELADAVLWKALSGFDFSAYALAIHAVAQASPGADLFVVNDSVLGPFVDLDPILAAMPWDLAGFTASQWHENHLQSYAFQLRAVDTARAAALAPAVSLDFAYDHYRDVIFAQETQFARQAAQMMSVGALWYGRREMGDPSVHAALSLVRNGFPFLKRKLFHRDAALFPQAALTDFLEEHRHPLP